MQDIIQINPIGSSVWGDNKLRYSTADLKLCINILRTKGHFGMETSHSILIIIQSYTTQISLGIQHATAVYYRSSTHLPKLVSMVEIFHCYCWI